MVNFRQREVEHAVLDHDDVGTNGVYRAADGALIRIPAHIEMITQRAVVPGTYVANAHVYQICGDAQAPSDPKVPFPVKVTLTKLNPRVEEVARTEVTMSRLGEQRTAFQFVIGELGDVSVDREADVPFIPVEPKVDS
jgi:hypothetical protein